MLIGRRCAQCGREFDGLSTRLYCSKPCRRRRAYERECWDAIAKLDDEPTELLPGIPATLPERVQMRRHVRELKSQIGSRP